MPVRDSTSASITTTTAVSVPAPTMADGDTVFLAIFTRATNTLSAEPSGFIGVDSASGATSSSASGVRALVYRRYVATAANEPANYTATIAATGMHGSVIAVSVSGLDATDPVMVAQFTSDAGSDAVVASPSVTTPAAGALLLRFAAMNTSVGVASWATPDCTEIEDVATVAATNRVSAALGWEDQPTAAATGTAAWTATLVGGSTTYGPGAGITIAVGSPAVVASGGPDQTVEPGELVEVDCTGSTGPILSRNLTQQSGPNSLEAYIVGRTTETPTFYAPAPAGSTPDVYVFRETVTGAGNTATDDVTITVNPSAASAAGPSLRVGVIANGLAFP